MKKSLIIFSLGVLLINIYACRTKITSLDSYDPKLWWYSEQRATVVLLNDSLFVEIIDPLAPDKYSDYSDYRALFVLDPLSDRYIQTKVNDSLEVTEDYAVLYKYGLEIVSGPDTFLYLKNNNRTRKKYIRSIKRYCDSLGFVIE